MSRLIVVIFLILFPELTKGQDRPNVILIYTDDVGYGDLSCYGAKSVKTKNIDRIASEGLLFKQAHSAAATCTPSRYALLTGEYAWRKEGTGVAPGDAPMIITPERYTIADMFHSAKYKTAAIGKWHLGLGGKGQQDWNGLMSPGLKDLGFDYSYIMAATGDRVPCVFLENDKVALLDPTDPIEISYRKPFAGMPTGKSNPEMLKVQPSHGHDQALINGISRIGFMRGGKKAEWIDEYIADSITAKAVKFIEDNRKNPFFLYFATNDIHVPRAPHPRFVGSTKMGPRGDVISQMDWSVGKILETLDRLSIKNNTIVIFTSDNGPVVDDGYLDDAVKKLGDHQPTGGLRGGKYSKFEGGTRVPFIIRYPKKIKKGISKALVSQVDMMHTLARVIRIQLPDNAGPDSFDQWEAWLGINKIGRPYIVAATNAASLSIRTSDWKYIEPSNTNKYDANTNIELGHDTIAQVYHLAIDPYEKLNIYSSKPKVLHELKAKLESIKSSPRTRQ